MYSKQIGSRAQVMHGTVHHTSGGLVKADLKYNKHGAIVSKLKSEMAKNNPALTEWVKAFKKCRKDQQIIGFVPVGGKSKKGKKLHECIKNDYYGYEPISKRTRSASKSKKRK
jgi:hypothetical protein